MCCCPRKRAAAAAAASEGGAGPRFGPFAARGRGCGRGGGQCRGPPRFIRALFGMPERNVSGQEELGEAGYGKIQQGGWSGDKHQLQQQAYPSSSRYQDFPLEERSGKAKAEGDASESDEEYDDVEEKAFKETTTTLKHESTPPRYSQLSRK